MITVGGIDLEATYGLKLRDRQLPRLGGDDIATFVVPGAVESIPIGRSRSADELTVTGILKAASHAAYLAALDGLTAAIQGQKTIAFSDITDRVWTGRLQRGPSRTGGAAMPWISTYDAITIGWLITKPSEATAATVLTGSATATPLGSAPSEPVITIGAGATVIVEIRNGASAVLRSFRWDGAGGVLVINTPNRSVTLDGSNAIDGKTINSRWPILDPAEGAASYNITGASSVSFSYYRRWY